MGWTLFIVSSTTRRTSFNPLKGPMTDTVLPCTRIYVCVRSSNAFSAAGSQHPFQVKQGGGILVPFCPSILCLRLTKRSLFRTMLRILMMSHAMPSSRILMAWGAGTERARSLIRSRALRMAAGSKV